MFRSFELNTLEEPVGRLRRNAMAPIALLEQALFEVNGSGPAVEISGCSGKLLVATLGISSILEQETLTVSIWGSPDGTNWGSKPLASFPPKSYCGLYSVLLNLCAQPGTRYLRVQWQMQSWRNCCPPPLRCEFHVDAEESGARIPARRILERARTAAA